MSNIIDNIKNITILGAGMMGPGMAQIFAFKGYNVTLWARRAEVLPGVYDTIRNNMKPMVAKGIHKEEDIETTISRIKVTNNFDEAVADADFVDEAIGENLELKQDFFKRMDEICRKDTILASNTSVISITRIAEKSINKDRIVGTHFWNPPHLIPLVEVVKTEFTSDDTMDKTVALLDYVGKKAVRVKKDVPGFLANQLPRPLARSHLHRPERHRRSGRSGHRREEQLWPSPSGPRAHGKRRHGRPRPDPFHPQLRIAISGRRAWPSPILKEKVEAGSAGFQGKRKRIPAIGLRKESPGFARDWLITFLTGTRIILTDDVFFSSDQSIKGQTINQLHTAHAENALRRRSRSGRREMNKMEADVVVIAGGPAGLAAAVAAAEGGAKVILFEKALPRGAPPTWGWAPLLWKAGSRRPNRSIHQRSGFQNPMDYTHWRVDAKLVRDLLHQKRRHHRLA